MASILYDTIKTEDDVIELAEEYITIYSGVEFGGFIYLPEHYLTGDLGFMKGETKWVRYTNKELAYKIRDTHKVIVPNRMWSSLYAMSKMYAQAPATPGNLTFRDGKGISQILPDNTVAPYEGEFTTYYLDWKRGTRDDVKTAIYSTIVEWVGGTEDANKLLDLLATAINPHFSVHRYLLLIGSGRNGKSTLLKMVDKLLKGNVSYVSRQEMTEKSTTLLDLNGKLANIIFDGQRKFISDSGVEKSIIVGEQVAIRPLYESAAIPVATNALFIEGLNHEPMSADKSAALQKRLMRFKFVNEYAEDITFEKRMLSQEAIEGLFALLLERTVSEDAIGELVAETDNMIAQRLEHQVLNNDIFEFINQKWGTDAVVLGRLITGNYSDINYESFREEYITWRSVTFNVKEFSLIQAGKRLSQYFDTVRFSQRSNGKTVKGYQVTNIRYELIEYLTRLYEEVNNACSAQDTLVSGDIV